MKLHFSQHIFCVCMCVSTWVIGISYGAVCKTSNHLTHKKNKLSNTVHLSSYLKCKCGKDKGREDPDSECSDGFCKISALHGACRTRVFCNRTKAMWDVDKLGHPSLDCLESTHRQFTYAVYDCVTTFDTYNSHYGVLTSCTTRNWNREAIGCCTTDMCNARLDPLIDGVHSNMMFYPHHYDGNTLRILKERGAPAGYPCNDWTDCRLRSEHSWCQNKWNARVEANPEYPENVKVCCSQQPGQLSPKNENQRACCGSNTGCNYREWHSGGFHCVCDRRPQTRVVAIGAEKPDGSTCQSDTECLSRICVQKEEGNKVCCTGTELGSYCSDADNIMCCGKATFCGTDHKCNSKDPGGKCNSNGDCYMSECKSRSLRNNEWTRLVNDNGFYPNYRTNDGPGFENAKVCCKGNLGDACPICATASWQYAGNCYGCCEGLTCINGKCSNLLALGESCRFSNDCASGRCRSRNCCLYSTYYADLVVMQFPFRKNCQSSIECCRVSLADGPRIWNIKGNGTVCCELNYDYNDKICWNYEYGKQC